MYCFVLWCNAMYCTVLYWTVRDCTLLYCTVSKCHGSSVTEKTKCSLGHFYKVHFFGWAQKLKMAKLWPWPLVLYCTKHLISRGTKNKKCSLGHVYIIHQLTFIDQSACVFLTSSMPIYCLEFDLFEKNWKESGKIEYCAICPIWPGSAVRVPTSPSQTANPKWSLG